MSKYILLIIALSTTSLFSCRTNAEQGRANKPLDADYRLHNIWALTYMNDKEMSRNDFPRAIPYLEFNLREKRFMGNNGCKELVGNFKTKKNQQVISFGKVTCSKGNCEDNENSNAFVQLISRRKYTYEFGRNKLIFKDGDREVLKFKNVD
ncbi:MAG: META domain-containing protein [Bacteroidales bacterium]